MRLNGRVQMIDCVFELFEWSRLEVTRMDGCKTKSLQKMVVRYKGAVATNDEEKGSFVEDATKDKANFGN